MTYLIASIVFNGLIFLIFRLLKKGETPIIPTLVVNYLTAFTLGAAMTPNELIQGEPWMYGIAFLIGFCFISIFFLMARCSIDFGMGFSSVLTKLSMVIPIIGTYFFFHEKTNYMGVIGILLSIPAILFIIRLEKKSVKALGLPLLLFGGSGALDLILKTCDQKVFPYWSLEGFIPWVFLSAGFFGALRWKKTKDWSFVKWGIILGLVNYGSMWFLLKAMSQISGVLFFPLNNLGIILFSTLLGMLVFKEQFTRNQKWGFLLACVAILCMSF